MKIATRKSALALAQVELLKAHFSRMDAGFDVEVMKMTTTGDRQREWSLEKEGGKGLFTKELESALLEKRADIAVHSAKDLPTEVPDGLTIVGFLERENTVDVLVSREGVDVKKIATGSPRRRAQTKLLYPDIEWAEIRGNVETRLNKILEGEADATILAQAGLNRLGINEVKGLSFKPFTVDEMVPAAGQGAIAIQCRTEDADIYQPFLDEQTKLAVDVERLCLEQMGGGCHSAMAAYCDGSKLFLFHEDYGRKVVALENLTEFTEVEAKQILADFIV